MTEEHSSKVATNVQFGPLMWLVGPKRAKMGSKWAQFTHFVYPKWSVQDHFWEMVCVFDPFLTHFYPERPIFKGIWAFLEGQQRPPKAQKGLKPLVLAYHVV